MSDLDEAKTRREWLAGNVAGFAGPFGVEKFAGGQSNPTYRIDAASGSYVLRRKPFGPILPSAHAVEREHQLIAALHPTGFPVARPYGLVRGCRGDRRALLHHGDGRGADLLGRVAARHGAGRADRACTRRSSIRSRRCIRPITPRSGWGNTASRAIISSGRWRAGRSNIGCSQTDDMPEVERLIEWLPRTVPEQTRTCDRPWRLPHRQHDLRRREPQGARRCSTGNCRRSAIRWRISLTS